MVTAAEEGKGDHCSSALESPRSLRWGLQQEGRDSSPHPPKSDGCISQPNQ